MRFGENYARAHLALMNPRTPRARIAHTLVRACVQRNHIIVAG